MGEPEHSLSVFSPFLLLQRVVRRLRLAVWSVVGAWLGGCLNSLFLSSRRSSSSNGSYDVYDLQFGLWQERGWGNAQTCAQHFRLLKWFKSPLNCALKGTHSNICAGLGRF